LSKDFPIKEEGLAVPTDTGPGNKPQRKEGVELLPDFRNKISGE